MKLARSSICKLAHICTHKGKAVQKQCLWYIIGQRGQQSVSSCSVSWASRHCCGVNVNSESYTSPQQRIISWDLYFGSLSLNAQPLKIDGNASISNRYHTLWGSCRLYKMRTCCWRSSISVLVIVLMLVSTGRGRQIRLASKIPFYLL